MKINMTVYCEKNILKLTTEQLTAPNYKKLNYRFVKW